jgi:hypothetical protein
MMADYENSIFDNLPGRQRRRLDDDDNTRSHFREVMGMYVPEGPLPPRPHQSGKGGPSIVPKKAGGATSVWSASDAAANGMTLSNGGLTVTSNPVGGGWGTVRNTINKTSGKWYVEFLTVSPASDSRIVIGVASSGFNPVGYIGNSNYSGGVYPGSNFVSTGFTSHYAVFPITPAAGSVSSIAIDFDAGNIWFGYNNGWGNQGGDPATGAAPVMSFVLATVGALFFGLSFYAADNVVTIQSTEPSQKYAPPSGFSPWG